MYNKVLNNPVNYSICKLTNVSQHLSLQDFHINQKKQKKQKQMNLSLTGYLFLNQIQIKEKGLIFHPSSHRL